MRAAVLAKGRVVVRDDVEEPKPDVGQVLVEVRACGICGTDLHFARDAESMLALNDEVSGSALSGVGFLTNLDLERDIYLGHEFVAEVLDFGPDTSSTVKPGAIVTSLPLLVGADGPQLIIYGNDVMGGYCERMLLTAPLLLELPNGLRPELAALTEPMSVGLHAVNKGNVQPADGALVIGCGPVGLAVIAALKIKGVAPIIAADFSPSRRQLAVTMGAHEALDPREESPWVAWTRLAKDRTPVVFEAIGVPGVLDDIMRMAPTGARIVVVGMCMQSDKVTPFFGVSKELSIQFAMGCEPSEFAGSLRSIAEGEINAEALVTAEVGLEQVGWAFDALRNPEEHCKILVTPSARTS